MEDVFDLEDMKKFRNTLEILFDGEGKVNPDEILDRLDTLIERVEQNERDKNRW